ncbi:MAG: triose-phosphate isomerase [Candidatus Micrarchaeota archaeon]|nr:triose-phosphate isomerase [Candidatus Micrarchaeota archaeon]
MKTLIINFKAYPNAFNNGVGIAEFCARSSNKDLEILVAPPATMLRELAAITPTIAQHVEPIPNGPHTGKITVRELKESGAIGTILNHSENWLGPRKLKEAVKMLKAQKLISIACVETSFAAERILAKTKPDYVVLEPPELIGGDVSVSVARKSEILEFVSAAKEAGSKPLIGAGIRSRRDIEDGIEFGAEGFVVSSSIMLSENYRMQIRTLAEAILRK